jgi:hypothetical protein
MYPVNSPQFAGFRSSVVHNVVYVPHLAQFDRANVWLSK